MNNKKCAILSMDCLDDFEAYDHLIEPYMAEHGWHVDTISWRAQGVDWASYQAVVIRTPWDYQDDAPAFLRVLEQIESSGAHLENSLDVVRWNIDKIYLKELEQLGVKLVPTLWHDRLSERQLTSRDVADYFDHFSSDQIVIKPRISANADNTFWLKQGDVSDQLGKANLAFSTRDFMVQPFMPAITQEGEFSLFYFNGQYSHAILKTPKAQDFRVQEEHGGQLQSVEPEQELVAQANKCLAAIDNIHGMPLYVRVDYVRHQDTFVLMEAELIEPSLYFNMDPKSPKRFVDAFVSKLEKLT